MTAVKDMKLSKTCQFADMTCHNWLWHLCERFDRDRSKKAAKSDQRTQNALKSNVFFTPYLNEAKSAITKSNSHKIDEWLHFVDTKKGSFYEVDRFPVIFYGNLPINFVSVSDFLAPWTTITQNWVKWTKKTPIFTWEREKEWWAISKR